MRLTMTALMMLALTACPPTPNDTGPVCQDVNEDGEPGHPDRVFYVDNDGDVFGGDEVRMLCSDPQELIPAGVRPFTGDCDDDNDAINPDADEVCDGIDNDCDGEVDVDALDAIQWHEDADGDGYGDAINGPKQCGQPEGHVENNDDCDDSSSQIFPGSQGCE